jgi:hypothetical protein
VFAQPKSLPCNRPHGDRQLGQDFLADLILFHRELPFSAALEFSCIEIPYFALVNPVHENYRALN